MSTRVALALAASLFAAVGLSQPLPGRPTLAPSPAGVPTDLSSPVRLMTPADAAVDARAKARLRDYAVAKARAAVSDADFAAAGLSPEHDFREQARTVNGMRLTPFHAARLEPIDAADRLAATAIDPALAAVYRVSLRARLGRAPTDAEISAEVQAFDARIAAQNTQMAAARPEIAARYLRDGTFPRDIEQRWLNVAPTDPERNRRHDREWTRVLAALLATAPSTILPPQPAPGPLVPVPRPPSVAPR